MLTLAVVVLAFAMLPLAILVGARTIDSQLTLAEKQVADYRTVSATTLADSWYVEILDPVWGRNDVLLPAVLAALTSRQ